MWLFNVYLIILFQSSAENHTLNNGVRFVEGMTWEQIKTKAKLENKYIFIDFYATWCAPCKKMENEVFSNDTVGDYMNRRFVSVRFQIDTTEKDGEEIRKMYGDASSLAKQFNIKVLPTFLFFSPNGKIVHKDISRKNVKQFMSLVSEVMDSDKQFYTMLERFRQNDLNVSQLPLLAKKAVLLEGVDLATQIASSYIHQFLDTLTEVSLFTKEHLAFIDQYSEVLNSHDNIFRLFLESGQKADIIMQQSYARNIVDKVIAREEIFRFQNETNVISQRSVWKKIFNSIKEKYGVECAKRLILKTRPEYYFNLKDWDNFTKFLVIQVESGELLRDTSFSAAYTLNHKAWGIFLYSKRKTELRKALKWMDRSLYIDSVSNMLPAYLDTKANLLYKLDRKDEALLTQEKALKLAPKSRSIVRNYEKMKSNERTWIRL